MSEEESWDWIESTEDSAQYQRRIAQTEDDIRRAKLVKIGYQEAAGEYYEDLVQEGFNLGYKHGCVKSFYPQFLRGALTVMEMLLESSEISSSNSKGIALLKERLNSKDIPPNEDLRDQFNAIVKTSGFKPPTYVGEYYPHDD